MSLKKASSSLASRSRVGFTPTGGGAAVTISNIIVTDSSWNNLDDTAVGTSSSYIKIIGSGFVVNPSVYIGTTQVSSGSITFVSSTELRVVLPSLSLGTQNLFVFNTDYSGAIWSAGLVVSGFPDYTQTTYISSTPLSVSVQLLATGDAPLTYALQGGSSLPAGTSLSSSGLITGTTTDGTYQFTVIVSDAQNQSFQQQLTLTITSADQYFNITPLAINADVGNTFASDASTNNFPITINGDTKPSAFSPYNTNWSNYFDGTGDYLNQSTNRFLDGSTWTVEGWVYTSDTTATIAAQYVASGGQFSSRTILGISSGLIYIFQAGSSVSGTTNISNNQWYHIAYVRNGSTVKAYVNGILEATFSGFINPSLTTTTFFYDGFNSGQELLGYFSNLRVTTTEVYASNFTPPTSPLTAITGTALLTCQSNRLIDNSTNNFTITKNGDVKISAFGPFTETDTTTGSAYFDGSGDYLTLPSDAALNLGTGAFSVEFWVYITSLAENPTFINTNGTLIFYEVTGSNRGLCVFANSAAQLTSSTTALPLNAWNHVVVCRNSSGNLSSFVNGIRLATVASNTSTFDFSGGIVNRYFPSSSGHLFGYTSSLRIVKGSTPYDPTQSTLTVPSASLTAIANTSLLTLQTRQPVNNHTFIDVSGNSNLITRTGNVSQGSFSPFSPAGWSGYFDGTGDYLSLSARSFAGDFTLEAWIYPLRFADSNGSSILFCSTSPNNQVALAASGVTTYYNGSTSISSGTGRIVLNTWQHYAICRSGTTTRIFVNGVLVASNLSDSGTRTFTFIGHFPDGNNYHFQGYMSNVRWATTARYTAAFTPPSSILSSDANTSLLTCQSNRFIDNSTNNFTITRNGDAAVVNFSPFAPTAAYSPVTHGGSAYFDGTGDYTTATGNSLLLGSNNFTIEGWFYFNNGIENVIKVMCVNYSAGFVAGSIYFGKHNNNSGLVTVWIYNHSSTGPMLIDPTLPPTKEWVHYAVVRSGNAWALYRNGVSVATATSSASLFSTTNNFFNIGGSPESSATTYNGYISGFKITNGTALYTSNFSVPTSPATTSNSTSLLLGYNNAAIVDASSRNVMETVGDAKIVTSTRKYGTGSMYFDGTGDYLTSSATPNLNMGTGDWTVEGWVYVVTRNSNYPLIIGNNNGGFTAGALALTVSNADNASYNDRFVLAAYDLGGTRLLVANTTNNFNTWYHFAVVRNGTNLTIYRNGISLATTTISAAFTFDWGKLGLRIGGGNWDGINGTYNGYIDDLRITRFARYTANFTPPTSTFLAQ